MHATFPNACDVAADPPFEHDVLAEAAAFHMAAGEWSRSFDTLLRGLSSGYPDACAYDRPAAMFVKYAMTLDQELLGSGDASSAESWAEGRKKVFVLQAWVLRYNSMLFCCVAPTRRLPAVRFTKLCMLQTGTHTCHYELSDEQLRRASGVVYMPIYKRLDLIWRIGQLLDHDPLRSKEPAGFLALAKAIKAGPFKQRCTAAWLIFRMITHGVGD